VRFKRALSAVCLAASVAFGMVAILGGGGIDWCEFDWVQNSSFWRAYFNCSDNPAGGGGSGAGD
jgi:hypothetical protein